MIREKTKMGFFTNNKYVFASLTILASLGIAQIANAQSAPLAEGVAAVVNDDPITSFDVRQRMRYILARQRIERPTNDIINQVAEQALDGLINEKLQMQEARKFKLKVSDAEVDRVLAGRVKQNGGSLDNLFAELRGSGLSVASYRDTTRAEIAWQRIVVGRYGSRVKIPADRIKESVARIQASAHKRQYSVSEIFIETPTPEEDSQTLQGAQTIVNKIRAGESFRANAEIYSYAPSAAQGGNLGWVLEGELRPEVAAIVDKIEIGSISDPIKVQGGYMIVGVSGIHEPKNLSTNYTLKEISKNLSEKASPEDFKKAEAQLMAAKNQYKGNCSAVERAAKANNVSYSDLGKIEDTDLNKVTLDSIKDLKNGGASGIVRTKKGLAITIMCEKVVSGEDIPTYSDIEDNLRDQELNLIARRYLRDIRREAAIVKR